MGKLELIQTVKKDSGRVWNLAWHPKGEVFASCGDEKSIRIWGKDITGKWSNKVNNSGPDIAIDPAVYH